MSIKSRKLFAILVVTMMVLSLLPMTAFATSTNSVDKVPQVAIDKEFMLDAPVLSIKEKDSTIFSSTSGETFRLSLTNAEWLPAAVTVVATGTTTDGYAIEGWDGTKTATFKDAASTPVGSPIIVGGGSVIVTVLTKTLAEVTVVAGDTAGNTDEYSLPLYTKVTGEGEAQVTIDARESRLSSATYPFANAAAGATVASISKVQTFARSTTLGDIIIDETRVEAIKSINEPLKIKLPSKFSWDITNAKAVRGGGITGFDVAGVGVLAELDNTYFSVSGSNGNTLNLTFKPDPANRTSRGSIILKGLKIQATRDAAIGEVLADIEGTNITSQELVVANYQNFNVEASIKEVKEVVAGRYDNVTAKIKIEENLDGAMINGRDIMIVLPEWVKVVGTKGGKSTNCSATWTENDVFSSPASPTLKIESNQNECYITADPASGKSKYEFELVLSVEADKTGDIVAEFSGAGMEKQELVIATAVAPVTAEVAASDLKIGVQDQPAPDIIITETKKGMIDDYREYCTWSSATSSLLKVPATASNFALTVTLPKGHDFAGTPTVEVTEGNLDIGKATAKDNVLTIPIKSSSTKPSTIKISNVKVTLDRTVPEGAFNANIGGTAIVKNSWEDATKTTPLLFDKGRVVRFQYANVITPAPGETRATTTFTIDSTTYTVVEAGVAVEKTMDVAPYIKNGRTYLPVRFVADALGVNEDNIVWDPVKASVTIFKGDRIAQMTIGSNALMVNGVELTMDAVPEIVDGRTMLPVRWVAQALGANIDWDAETQTVTVKQ